MTSNRADIIDQAFHSRIHLTLHYPDLGPDAKEHTWRQFTSRSQSKIELTDEGYKRLAQLPLNGRQIKNVLRVATLIAIQDEPSNRTDSHCAPSRCWGHLVKGLVRVLYVHMRWVDG